MTVDLCKYLVRDIKKIMFDDLDTWLTVEYDGHRLNLENLSADDRKWIVTVVCEAYEQGGRRTVDCINRDGERQRRQAQKRALDRMAKRIDKL